MATTFELPSGAILDFSTLPVASIDALLTKGAAHYFGNEASSKIVSKVRRANTEDWIAAAPDGTTRIAKDAPKMTSDDVSAWREANAAQIVTWAVEIENEQLKALMEGTVGETKGGAKLDPFEARIEKLAKDYITTFVMKANGIKDSQWSKDKPVTINGASFTFMQLVKRRIEKDRPNLEASARKELAAEQRKAEKAKEQAAAALAELLG